MLLCSRPHEVITAALPTNAASTKGRAAEGLLLPSHWFKSSQVFSSDVFLLSNKNQQVMALRGSGKHLRDGGTPSLLMSLN